MVKLDREPTQAAFDFGCLPKTIGSGESTAQSIAIHLNTCQSFSAVVKSLLFGFALSMSEILCTQIF